MERLSTHIAYLLLRHDCVVVPGLGALINVRLDAHVDRERGVIVPMRREVRFNSALVHDDGLLAHSYARKYQVTFQEGRDMLRRSVEALRDSINRDGEATIGRLGILRNEDGALRFLPFLTADEEAERMGRASARFSPRLRVEKAEAAPLPAADTEAATAESEAIAVSGTRVFDTKRNYYIAVNKMFARTVACIMVVAMLALTVLMPVEHAGDLPDQASVVPVETIIKKVATVSENLPAAAKSHKKAETAEANLGLNGKAESDRKAQEATSNLPMQYLIVATFSSKADAEQFIASRNGGGYRLEAVPGKTLVRVSAKKSTDRAELLELLNSAKFQSEFAESWIWSEKK